MNWKVFMANLVKQMLGSVSINLAAQLKEFAIKFRTDARATDNPWDDILADFLCLMLGIPAETE